MKSKILILAMLLVISIASLASLVSAKDVIYLVTDGTDSIFIQTLDELGLSYDVKKYYEVDDFNFSDYKLILLADDYFVNWYKIPINNMPALVASGRDNVANWGWTVRTTEILDSSNPLRAGINLSNPIARGFNSSNVSIYTSKSARAYIMDKMDIYTGFQLVAYSLRDRDDALVAFAPAGTVLTHAGKSDTLVNADSVYFGITQTQYWTSETKQLFKNSLQWLYEQSNPPTRFNITIKSGWNAISLPFSLAENNVSDIFGAYPAISSVKKYESILLNASEMQTNEGYFVYSSSDLIVPISGYPVSDSQSINLKEGMNLVGIASLSNRNFSSLNLPAEVMEISKRNSNGVFTRSTKYGGIWFNDFNFEPGSAYWIKANADATWTYVP